MKALVVALVVLLVSGCATIVYPKHVALPEDEQGPMDVNMLMRMRSSPQAWGSSSISSMTRSISRCGDTGGGAMT